MNAVAMTMIDLAVRYFFVLVVTFNPLLLISCVIWTIVHTYLLYAAKGEFSLRFIPAMIAINSVFVFLYLATWVYPIKMHQQGLIVNDVVYWKDGDISATGWIVILKYCAIHLAANIASLSIAYRANLASPSNRN